VPLSKLFMNFDASRMASILNPLDGLEHRAMAILI
jgi:hypothetical protein